MNKLTRRRLINAFKDSYIILRKNGRNGYTQEWTGFGLIPELTNDDSENQKTLNEEILLMESCWLMDEGTCIPGFIAAAFDNEYTFKEMNLNHPAILYACVNKDTGSDDLYIKDLPIPYGLKISDILFRFGNLNHPMVNVGDCDDVPDINICISRECIAASLDLDSTWRYFGHNIFQIYEKNHINAENFITAAKKLILQKKLSIDQLVRLINDAAVHYLDLGDEIGACKAWSLLAHPLLAASSHK